MEEFQAYSTFLFVILLLFNISKITQLQSKLNQPFIHNSRRKKLTKTKILINEQTNRISQDTPISNRQKQSKEQHEEHPQE